MDKVLQTMIDNMPEKTGKPLEEWLGILKQKSFDKHSEAVKYLKQEHGVTHGFANTIVLLSKSDNDAPDDLVKMQYKGKESLRPMYDKLIDKITKLGKDVKVVPKKGSVSLVRRIQFALIKPATKTRIDLGLKLKGKPTEGRLEDSGPFGTMCTHRVQLTSPDQIDDELMAWIKEAYDKAE